jgi:glutamine amidotransferase
MQVLFDAGVEHGAETAGLGVFPGRVEQLQAPVLPHMGWNTVSAAPGSRLFAGLDPQTRFYFVHSYAAHDTDGTITSAEHGERFVAAVERGAVSATQFHPEKSGDAGAALLENWVAAL